MSHDKTLPDKTQPISAPSSSSEAALPVESAPPSTLQARQIAGAILEVLAGVRSITDAAMALGISTARYYQWEARAVAGMLAACEPRSPGPLPGASLPAELEQLRTERDRLKAETARYQALVRIAQGAFGAPAAPVIVAEPIPAPVRRAAQVRRTVTGDTAPPRQRKKRTPSVRALRLAKRVREAPAAGASPSASQTAGSSTITTPSGGG